MKIKHIALQSVAIAALTLAGCNDAELVRQKPEPGASITFANISTGRVSRDASTPDVEMGDPNENAINKALVVIYERPLNDPGEGKVLKVLTFNDLDGGEVINKEGASTMYPGSLPGGLGSQVKDTDLKWYDENGAHDVYGLSQSYRAYISNRVTLDKSTILAAAIEDLIARGYEDTYLYALALVNVSATDMQPNLVEGMSVNDLRNIVYTGMLYHSNYQIFEGYHWGVTGFGSGRVRYTDFAMSAINEVKFKPHFDETTGRFEMPSPLMVQRMAARIDICFGVQAGGVMSGWTNKNGQHMHPYITDRAWYLKEEYNNDADNAEGTNPGPYSYGRGYRGMYGDIDPPAYPDHYDVKYLYDVDITGTDNQTGKTQTLRVNGSGELLDGDWKTFTNKDGVTVTTANYESLANDDPAREKISYDYPVTNADLYESNNYEGYYRFPIYDEDTFQANINKTDEEKNVYITGSLFYLEEIRLTNCNNVGYYTDANQRGGMYLFEQANVGGTRRYLGNEGSWNEQGANSYSTNFIYSYPNRQIGTRQLTSKTGADASNHRPVSCIQNGLRFPDVAPTRWCTQGDKKWGVYSTLGYVGENTYETDAAGNKYTSIYLAGASNLGHYFSDAGVPINNENNQRKPVSVEIKLRHSDSKGDYPSTGGNMHFGIVRNTVYRVYVKFYAKGEELGVRYYFYNQQDGSFEEIEYKNADFYSNVLEDDRYHEVVD